MIIALALLAAAAPSDRVTFVAPDLDRSGARLAAVLGWASGAEPTLGQLSLRATQLFGIDPLDGRSLRAAGIDPARPSRVTIERGVLVAELALADRAKALAHFGARGGAAFADAEGFVDGAGPASARAAVIEAARVWLVLGADARTSSAAWAGKAKLAKDPRLEALRRVRALKPREAPRALLEGGEPVDLWAVVEPGERVERVDLVLRAPKGALAIDAEALLELPAEVAIGEALRGRASAVRRVDAGPIAAELAATFTRAGLRALLGRARLPEAWAASFAGPVQAGVAADGTLYAALELDPRANAPTLLEALRAKLPAELALEAKDGLLSARLGAAALSPAPSAPPRGALALDVAPRALLSAIARHRERLGLRPMDLMMAQLVVGKLVATTESMRLDVSMPTNRLRLKLAVQLAS